VQGSGAKLEFYLMAEDLQTKEHRILGALDLSLAALEVNRSQRFKRPMHTAEDTKAGALALSVLLEKRDKYVRILEVPESEAAGGFTRERLQKVEHELYDVQAPEVRYTAPHLCHN
jgi:hypothetical protein